jgi:hypothetical protein
MAKDLFGVKDLVPFDAEYLRIILEYDPKTGLWRWRKSNVRRKIDLSAGYVSKERRRIRIDGVTYLSSILAWLYMTGEWPRMEIDHEDRNPSNDKWSNLRLATEGQQAMNHSIHSHNTSGITGVYQRGEKYCARIKFEYKHIWLGTFDTEEDAIDARRAAEVKYFGEFAPKPRLYTGGDLFK